MGKLRKPLGKAWASPAIEVSGNRRAPAGSQVVVGVGGDEVLTALTAISPGFLELFALTEGGKICSYGNLISSLPKLSPQGETISEIPRNLYKFNGASWAQVLKQSAIQIFQASEGSTPFLDSVARFLNRH